MKRRFGAGIVVITAAALLLGQAPAQACMNATLSSNESIAALKAAERALDEGDVLTARELTREVVDSRRQGRGDDLFDRATRLEALSYVRDPKATPEDLERAVTQLDPLVEKGANPSLAADFGEALERAGRDQDALATLSPLADKDLIGSAYAYAALGRAAARRGDGARARSAAERCSTMAANPAVCRGEYPRQPLLRGSPIGYALPCLVLALAALWRWLRGRTKTAPWTRHRVPLFAGVAVLGGAAAFASGRVPWFAAALAILSVLAAVALQRRAFLRACRAGKLPGFFLRAVEPGDERLPAIRLLALQPRSPTANPETLERIVDPSYRESARAPVLRIDSRRVRIGAVGLTVSIILLFAGCAAFTTFATLRKGR